VSPMNVKMPAELSNKVSPVLEDDKAGNAEEDNFEEDLELSCLDSLKPW
jgi:hypothetical protein